MDPRNIAADCMLPHVIGITNSQVHKLVHEQRIICFAKWKPIEHHQVKTRFISSFFPDISLNQSKDQLKYQPQQQETRVLSRPFSLLFTAER